MNENFDTFKQNVANIVKRIVLDQIESHCLSIEQCHQLCEAGFPYFTNNMFLSSTALIVYHCNHGNITSLMDNTKIYDYLDKHYLGMYQKANQNIENIYNDAINEVWNLCFHSMKGVVDFRNSIDWDRQYPMINKECRI